MPLEALSNLSFYLVLWSWRLSSDIFLQLSLVNMLKTAAVQMLPSVLQLSPVFYLHSRFLSSWKSFVGNGHFMQRQIKHFVKNINNISSTEQRVAVAEDR